MLPSISSVSAICKTAAPWDSPRSPAEVQSIAPECFSDCLAHAVSTLHVTAQPSDGLLIPVLTGNACTMQEVCRCLDVDLTGQTSASFNMRQNYERCLFQFEDYLASGAYVADVNAGCAPSADAIAHFVCRHPVAQLPAPGEAPQRVLLPQREPSEPRDRPLPTRGEPLSELSGRIVQTPICMSFAGTWCGCLLGARPLNRCCHLIHRTS